MKFLFDLFPVILFFAVFKLAGNHPEQAQALAASLNYQADSQHLPVLLATATAMIATLVQIIWVKIRHGKIDTMLWISFVIILVFGGATLALHDESFIKIKPTALYWLFAAVLLFARILFNKNFIKSLMESKFSLPDQAWGKLNLAWSGLFIVMGILNLYFAWNFSTETWVNFKLFGTSGIMLVFIFAQALWLSKHIEADKEGNQ